MHDWRNMLKAIYFPVDDDFAVLSFPWDNSRVYIENVSSYNRKYHILDRLFETVNYICNLVNARCQQTRTWATLKMMQINISIGMNNFSQGTGKDFVLANRVIGLHFLTIELF